MQKVTDCYIYDLQAFRRLAFWNYFPLPSTFVGL